MTSAQQLAYDEFVHNVFVTALEGGVNYWFVCKTYRWELGVGGGCDLENFKATGFADDEPRKPLTIDKAVIIKGLLRIVDGDATFGGSLLKPDGRIRQSVLQASAYDPVLNEYDVNTVVDADIADCIVQVGLFGDVRYG